MHRIVFMASPPRLLEGCETNAMDCNGVVILTSERIDVQTANVVDFEWTLSVLQAIVSTLIGIMIRCQVMNK
jgi:hypothetical protein